MPACDTRSVVHKRAQNTLNCARRNSFTMRLLRSNPSPNVLRSLYVPLPAFSAPDDVGWLVKAKQCGEDLKLSEILCWINQPLKLLRDFRVNC